MSVGRPEHRVTIDVPSGTSNLWLQQQLAKYPGAARLTINQEPRTSTPGDWGGRTTIELVWEEGR